MTPSQPLTFSWPLIKSGISHFTLNTYSAEGPTLLSLSSLYGQSLGQCLSTIPKKWFLLPLLGLKATGFNYVYIYGSTAESQKTLRDYIQAQAIKVFTFSATRKILKPLPMWTLFPTTHEIRFTWEPGSLSTNQRLEILRSSTQATVPWELSDVLWNQYLTLVYPCVNVSETFFFFKPLGTY